ncbi:MAG: bifunctional methylenetetrahydrofolate dehydrogenase/methenyltetrahydrofolate cyclohydrolase FolD [Betaproteobacteria bacterium]|nr:MAG: bifunctional methylenetetrahydrofolate dehydrogenase/methenyltetrahydrofolate cyclohydrolase FolD [Betaproteobacteria bacterium]
MTALILDGKQIAQKLRADWKLRADRLNALGIAPGLAVVMVGDNPASQVYVRNKIRACREIGIRSEEHLLGGDSTAETVLGVIDRLNADAGIHGILVQLPLPAQLVPSVVIERISPDKDVDGLHSRNLGSLLAGHPRFLPCTPAGIMEMLKSTGLDLRGKEAVVVGRSNIVGKPVALLLLQAGATVTLCHSQTRQLADHTRRADVLVSAVGKPGAIGGEMIKLGAVVIDVGINRSPNGKLVGDVDYGAARERAGWITPVPGGVGPMTIAMLLCNTILSAERHAAAQGIELKA